MSRAAEEYVNTCTDPRVKGAARRLLETLAKRIPEGQTMTAPISRDDLATLTGYDRRTLQTAQDLLVANRLLRIVGGGRGRLGCYELLLLEGAGPDPSLPLVGRVPSPPPRVQVGPTLFDQPELAVAHVLPIRAYTVGSFFLCWSNVGSFFLRWSNVGSFFLRCRQKVGSFFLRSLPLDVDDARARDVHTFKNTHTSRDGPSDPDGGKPPPREPLHPWHAWCGGRVHVPKKLHTELLAKMGRLAGETTAGQETRLIAFYVQTSANLPSHQPIGVDDYKFWRRAFAEAFANPISGRRVEEPLTGSTCPHEPRCSTRRACVDRILEEGRAERERKSG